MIGLNLKIDSSDIRLGLIGNIEMCDERYDSALEYLAVKIEERNWNLVSNTAQDLKSIELEREIYVTNLQAIEEIESVSKNKPIENSQPSPGMQLLQDDDE